MDKAVTNICLRPQLLEVYPPLRLEHRKEGVDVRQLTWFIDRSIRVSSVALLKDLCVEEILDVATLLQSCPALTSLNLSDCSNITDVGVEALSQGCPA